MDVDTIKDQIDGLECHWFEAGRRCRSTAVSAPIIGLD